MKSSFGSKRKARKIEVDEDDEGGLNDAAKSTEPISTRTYTSSVVKRLADLECTAD
jgi:hypothetical protein